jgi:AhpD family alkylhydroperoxidase
MDEHFGKRIFTPESFFRDTWFLISNVHHIARAFGNTCIDKAFVEKIMTVITAVNGCVYCAWFHAKQAMASGIREEEVTNLFNLQFHADASHEELTALLYAKHYAETDRHPDEAMTKTFYEFYGEKTATDLFMSMRMIYFGNLFGNTWDAVISRFRGHPVKDGTVAFEIVFFVLVFVFMTPTMLLIKD